MKKRSNGKLSGAVYFIIMLALSLAYIEKTVGMPKPKQAQQPPQVIIPCNGLSQTGFKLYSVGYDGAEVNDSECQMLRTAMFFCQIGETDKCMQMACSVKSAVFAFGGIDNCVNFTGDNSAETIKEVQAQMQHCTRKSEKWRYIGRRKGTYNRCINERLI